jgi:uncharacterized protein
MGGDDMSSSSERGVMSDLVSLTYVEDLTPNLERYADGLLEGRLIGQKCPTCGRVYVPGKGYCVMDVTVMAEADEVDVADTGYVSGYTIITPVQYYGQKETEPFVLASIALDGADNTIGQQDVIGIPHEQLRNGLRVKARWKPISERVTEGLSNRGGIGLEGVIFGFEPTGEPDEPAEKYQERLI